MSSIDDQVNRPSSSAAKRSRGIPTPNLDIARFLGLIPVVLDSQPANVPQTPHRRRSIVLLPLCKSRQHCLSHPRIGLSP